MDQLLSYRGDWRGDMDYNLSVLEGHANTVKTPIVKYNGALFYLNNKAQIGIPPGVSSAWTLFNHGTNAPIIVKPEFDCDHNPNGLDIQYTNSTQAVITIQGNIAFVHIWIGMFEWHRGSASGSVFLKVPSLPQPLNSISVVNGLFLTNSPIARPYLTINWVQDQNIHLVKLNHTITPLDINDIQDYSENPNTTFIGANFFYFINT